MPLILDGTLDLGVNIQDGTLNIIDDLNGEFGNYIKVSSQEYPYYNGDYEITPLAFQETVLPTTNKVLTNDVKVLEIPYYETSNTSNGYTVYIADSIDIGG